MSSKHIFLSFKPLKHQLIKGPNKQKTNLIFLILSLSTILSFSFTHKIYLLQLSKSVAKTVKPQNWRSRLRECAYTNAFPHRDLFIIEMFRLLALIWNGHIMIKNERMKFSRMRELDKVYRGLFRTLTKIPCDENVFAEIVSG